MANPQNPSPPPGPSSSSSTPGQAAQQAANLNKAYAKVLQESMRELQSSSRNMAKLIDELSNKTLDELTKKLKKTIDSAGLLSKAQLDQIKSAKDAYKALDHFEDIVQLQGKELARFGKTVGMSEQEVRAYKNQVEATIPALRGMIEEAKANRGVHEKMRLAGQKSVTQMGNMVQSFFSLSNASRLFEKALTLGYEQMVRLTNKGMLGAFMAVNKLSASLLLLPQEFEEIINKNRDLVNQLGGGTDGIENFAKELETAKDGLGYLGRDAAKAAARFMEASKNVGLTPKDGAAYTKNLNQMKDQFKRFSGLFGDSYDQYADLMEQQSNEEATRQRMNGLNKTQLAQLQEEIRSRTENLKMLGLSNTSIVEFNKRVDDAMNPRKNTQNQRMMEAINTQNAYATAMRSASPEQRAEMQKHYATMRKATELRARGGGKNLQAYKELMASDEGVAMAKAFSKTLSDTENNSTNGWQQYMTNRFIEGGGGGTEDLLRLGAAGIQGEQGGRNLKGLPPDELKKIQDNSAKMQQGIIDLGDGFMGLKGKAFDLGAAFEKASAAMAVWQNAKENPLFVAGTAAAAALGGFLLNMTRVGDKILSLFGLGSGAAGAGSAATAGGAAAAGSSTAAQQAAKQGAARMAGLRAAGSLALRASGVATAGYVGYKAGGMIYDNYGQSIGDRLDKWTGQKQDFGFGVPQGGRKGATTSAIPNAIGGSDINRTMMQIAGAESNFGKNAGKNPMSSASGMYQFTNGTWVDTVKKYGAKYGLDPKNMSRDQILALKGDPNLSKAMMMEFTQANQRAIGRTDATSTYLAHFLGAGGAKKVLDNPNAPIASLVGQDQMAANASVFRGMSTGQDLINWSAKKMDRSSTMMAKLGIDPGGAGAGAGTQLAMAQTSSASTMPADDSNAELKKQTALLAALVQNTKSNGAVRPPYQRSVTETAAG